MRYAAKPGNYLKQRAPYRELGRAVYPGFRHSMEDPQPDNPAVAGIHQENEGGG